jgi:hypothetical protein
MLFGRKEGGEDGHEGQREDQDKGIQDRATQKLLVD